MTRWKTGEKGEKTVKRSADQNLYSTQELEPREAHTVRTLKIMFVVRTTKFPNSSGVAVSPVQVYPLSRRDQGCVGSVAPAFRMLLSGAFRNISRFYKWNSGV